MKSKWIVCLVTLALASVAMAEMELRTVDVNKAFKAYNAAQTAEKAFQADVQKNRDELQKMFEKGKAEADKISKEIEKLQDNANNPALTEEARRAAVQEAISKQQEIRAKENEIQQFDYNSREQFSVRSNELQRKFFLDIKEETERMRVEKKVDMILNANETTLLAADPKFDLTDALIQRLNATQPAKAASESAKK